MTTITLIHKNRFTEIREKLKIIGSGESSFTEVEILFYEAIAISRNYGNNISDNRLLANLKQLEDAQYKNTQTFFLKRSQRERAIKRFITQLIIVLNKIPQD